MATGADSFQLATQARRRYTEEVVKGLVSVVQSALDHARELLDKPSEHAVFQRRRDLLQELTKGAQEWHRAIVTGLRHALVHGVSASRLGELPLPGKGVAALSLVDDDTIELEIVTSRLALAIMDRASWEFSDLRARISFLEGRNELDPHDLLRAHVLARVVFDAWRGGGLAIASWREIQTLLHDEFAILVEEAYHESNRWLVEQRVLPEVDLRPFIRRQRNYPIPGAPGSWQPSLGPGFINTGGGNLGDVSRGLPDSMGFGRQMSGNSAAGSVGEETRLMTRAAPLARSRDQAEAVLGRLNRLVAKHLPGFGAPTQPLALSPGLAKAIDTAQMGIRQRLAPNSRSGDTMVTTPVLLDELHQRKQVLKKAAATPEERATIEIVALLFQSILTEERIPAAVRVWFARLQMPVLRVAVSEPDFFATIDHPGRRLIDRMGACVIGFDGGTQAVGDALQKEIKRVVQVVEAYPDTGRRVFQTVLTEFEKFLEHYFKHENEATKKGVSLAQQVEQRETLAIQYTIELRKLLNEVPVQEGVRQFLFQVWADVMAITALRNGAHSDTTKGTRAAAVDLVWSAGAKVTREERAEVIRKLPPLLKKLRDGMESAGVLESKRDEHIRALNESLAAAFNAKAAAIPPERFEELRERLEALEEMLPDAGDVQLDETLMQDISGDESNALEVVGEGGSMPTPAMLSWAKELQVGSWYMLEYGDKTMAVQLAWQGMRRHLSLFVTTTGRCLLFEQNRLASYLQAGLLLPAQEEALTVRATRTALAKIDADPARLLN